MQAPRPFTTLTLGCKVNQYETQWVREGLEGAGYRHVDDNEPAQLCVVNTCTVTQEGDAKSRQAIRRLARQHPSASIVVMGCYASRAPEEVAALPNVVEVVRDKREIPDLLGRMGVVDVPDGISRFGDRHRAYIKVQDGCLLRCTYCIIPHVRPAMHSRSLTSILQEARRLIDHGYRELVLTGIHLGHYGVDFNRGQPKSAWIRLADLLARLVNEPGDFRIRLSSIEAPEVTDELLSVMAGFPRRICPHLHICLQSGSESVLRRMHRRWGAKRIIDRCQRVSDYLDQPALTTDVIVGFPGESAADFAATCDAVKRCGFSKIHIFPFSRRRGTPAADATNPIAPDVIRQRCRELADVERSLRESYFARLSGRTLQVLTETVDVGMPHVRWGTSCRYAPVQIHGAVGELGQLYGMTIADANAEHLIAVPSLGTDIRDA